MSHNAEHWLTNEPSMTAYYAAQAAAVTGSSQLLDRLEIAFSNHARKHRYTFEQSRLLCMNSTERM